MFGLRLEGASLLPLIEVNEDIFSWKELCGDEHWVVLISGCWKGLFMVPHQGVFECWDWVRSSYSMPFCKALIGSYKVVVIKHWWAVMKRWVCFMVMKCSLPCGHLMLIPESVCSHWSCVHGTCFGWTSCPAHSHSAMLSQWFPSSTWTLTRSSSLQRQLRCIPAAWCSWHGTVWLGSGGLQQAGSSCFPWTCCTAVHVCLADCWKGPFCACYLPVWLG